MQQTSNFKSRRALYLILLLSICSTGMFSQRNFGVVFDKEAYEKIPLIQPATGVKGDDIPAKISLRPFCPVPAAQGDKSSCTAFCVGYGAMSVYAAIQNNLTDSLSERAFSAAFIYNQVKQAGNCQEGISVEDALRFLKTRGNCRFVEFDTSRSCQALPDSVLRYSAARNQIYDYAAVLPYGANSVQTTAILVNYLRNKIPVIVVFRAFENFFSPPPGEQVWSKMPDEKELGLHCLLVIGYDIEARTFDVMSSWGPNWADHGFYRVNWSDMGAYTLAAYIIKPNVENFVADLPKYIATPPKPPTLGAFTLEGETKLRRVREDGKPYPEEVLQRDPVTGFYTVPAGAFDLNTGYQLLAGGTYCGKYIYTFSCDALGEISKIYPKSYFSALSPGIHGIVTIPSTLSRLILELPGDELVCMLYSEREIPDLEARLRSIRGATVAGFNEKMQEAFGDLLVRTGQGNRIEYAPDRMQVKANVVSGNGSLVPVVLHLQTKKS